MMMNPMMMNTTPNMMHQTFNIGPGAHPSFNNSTLVNPRFNIAPGASPSFSNSVVVNPRVNNISPFHQSMIIPTTNRVTNGLFVPPQTNSLFPTTRNGVFLPLAGQAQLAQLGFAPFGSTPFIPTSGFTPAAQLQLAQLGLLPSGLAPFGTPFSSFGVPSFGTPFGTPGLSSGFSFMSGSSFAMPLWGG